MRISELGDPVHSSLPWATSGLQPIQSDILHYTYFHNKVLKIQQCSGKSIFGVLIIEFVEFLSIRCFCDSSLCMSMLFDGTQTSDKKLI